MSKPGNSLIEYTLPLVVFMAAGIAMILMTDLPTRMQAFISGTLGAENSGGGTLLVRPLGSQAMSSAAGTPAVSGLPGIPGTASGAPGTASAGSMETICFGSGFCSRVPAVDNVETAGGLGGDAVSRFASALQNVSEVLAEAEDVDPLILDQVTRLANNGHSIADVMQRLEKACGNMGSCSFSISDGESWEVNEETIGSKHLYDTLTHCGGQGLLTGCDWDSGDDSYSTQGFTELKSFLEAKAALDQYFQEHPELANSPYFQDAKKVIDYEAGQIDSISRNMTVTVDDDGEGSREEALENAHSGEVGTRSNTVCGHGGNMGECYTRPD